MKSSYFFEEETNYIFDSDKIQIIGGVAKLKATSAPGEAYAYWTMDDNVGDLAFRDVSGNSRDGVFQGTYTSANKVPAKINNGLQGLPPTSGIVNMGNTYYNFERTDSFSLECWIKFTADTVQTIISKQDDTTPFNGYGINVQNGLIRFVIRDLINVIAVQTAGTYNDDIFHHVVVTYNGNSQDTGMKIYVDNVLDTTVFVAGTLTGSIVNTFNFQISGRNGNNNCILDTTIMDEVVVYERELTAAEVAFRWNDGFGTQVLPGAGTSFPTDNPTIRPVTNITVKEFLTFAYNIIETGADEIRGVVSLNNFDFYWDGLDWIESSGYSESNTLADIVTNLTNLLLSENTLVQFKFYLHSDDGSTTPEIEDFEFDYNVPASIPILNETIIYSTLLDLAGDAEAGEVISVKDGYIYGDSTIISDDYINTTTATDGSWEITIKYENVEPTFLIWQFKNKLIKTNFVSGARVSFGELTILEECDAV